MSDAIRCKACRWWREIRPTGGIHRGICEIDVPIYVQGDPNSYMSWHQPIQTDSDGCSRGKPKLQKIGETTEQLRISKEYSNGFNSIREEMFRHGILRIDPRSGFSDVTSKEAYTDFLAGVEASLQLLRATGS